MSPLEMTLRIGGPLLLGLLTALFVHHMAARRGFEPPGFRLEGSAAGSFRRLAALMVLTGIFALGLFGSLGSLGLEAEPLDPEAVTAPALFLLQGLLLLSLVTWFVLGYVGTGSPEAPWKTFSRQFGLQAREPGKELLIGLGAGLVGWVGTIVVMLSVFFLIWAFGGESLLPSGPPEMVPLIAGLPFLVRVGISLSAGIVEELFFRGFLQPRVGILLSTGLFALAHLSYGQPFMLVGIIALSLFFAFLVRWRRSILAAIVAHAAFDAIQLLILIPAVLNQVDG